MEENSTDTQSAEAIATDSVGRASDRVTEMTALDPSMSVSQFHTTRVENTGDQETVDPVAGVMVTVDEPLVGSIGVMFDCDSAAHIVTDMLSATVTPQGALGTEALSELATIIAGEVTDCWAEAVDTSLSRSDVEYVTGTRSSIVESVMGRHTASQLTSFAVDCQFKTVTGESQCVIQAALDLSGAACDS